MGFGGVNQRKEHRGSIAEDGMGQEEVERGRRWNRRQVLIMLCGSW